MLELAFALALLQEPPSPTVLAPSLLAGFGDQDDDGLTPERPLDSLKETRRLMERSEEHLNDRLLPASQEKQREVIARLERLIRAAREAAPRTSDRRDPTRGEDARPDGRNAAPKTHDPKAYTPGKFVGREHRNGWPATLPPGMREAILHALAHIDEYPEEMRAILREWSHKIAAGDK